MFPKWFKQDEATGNEGSGGEDNRDYAKEASTMGWVPQNKWTGPEDKWVDAKTFVERGETVLPILRKTNRELEEKLNATNAEMAQLRADAETFKKMVQNQAKREKEELIEQHKAALLARAKAVTDGDGERFEEADAEVKELEDKAKELDQQANPPKKADDGLHPEFKPWLNENKWYQSDEELNFAANWEFKKLADANTPLRGKALYDEVKKKVMARFPAKFETDDQARGSSVEGRDGAPSGDTRPRKTGKGYDSMPADAKATCDRYIKAGWINGKDDAAKRAAYAVEYWAQFAKE